MDTGFEKGSVTPESTCVTVKLYSCAEEGSAAKLNPCGRAIFTDVGEYLQYVSE